MQHYIFFDLETSGLTPKNHQILEIGAIKCHSETFESLDHFQSFIYWDPSPSWPYKFEEEARKVNKITNQMLSTAAPEKDILKEFLAFTGNNSIWVAYNAMFDVSHIQECASRNNITLPNLQVFDALELIRYVYGQLPSHTLSKIAEHLNVNIHNSHRSFDDSIGMLEVFKKTCKLLNFKTSEVFKFLHPIHLNDILEDAGFGYFKFN